MEKKFKITVDDRQYIVTVEDITEGESLIFPEPGSMSIPQPAAPQVVEQQPKVAPAAGPGDELSPLAGVVQSVAVVLGQEVKEGDKLATIEAMKMNTAVIAHHSGKITNILIKPGDAVEAGQCLFTIG